MGAERKVFEKHTSTLGNPPTIYQVIPVIEKHLEIHFHILLPLTDIHTHLISVDDDVAGARQAHGEHLGVLQA